MYAVRIYINKNLSTITKNDKRFNATDDRINII
ncbi:TPA: hypothetical protein O8097_000267 [Staphylococcus aureus]|nr:hypothetical protein [Staphylococcus aureus]